MLVKEFAEYIKKTLHDAVYLIADAKLDIEDISLKLNYENENVLLAREDVEIENFDEVQVEILYEVNYFKFKSDFNCHRLTDTPYHKQAKTAIIQDVAENILETDFSVEERRANDYLSSLLKYKRKRFLEELEMKIKEIDGVEKFEFLNDDDDDDDQYDYDDCYLTFPTIKISMCVTTSYLNHLFEEKLVTIKLFDDIYYGGIQNIIINRISKKISGDKEDRRRADNIANANKIFQYLSMQEDILLKKYSQIESLVLTITECDPKLEPGKAKIAAYLYLKELRTASVELFVNNSTSELEAFDELLRLMIKQI